MIDDAKMLGAICQNAEMGRDSIMHVVKISDDTNFRRALEEQLADYQKTYDEADRLLKERGQTPKPVPSMAKMMSYTMSSAKTMRDNSPSTIARMMIEGSTMGIVKMTQHVNQYSGQDPAVASLAKRQIKKEQSNIEVMKKFL